MKPSPFSPDEEDAIAKEVQQDLDAGQGEKHFQDLFDSLAGSPSSPAQMDPDVRDRLKRFAFEFQVGLNDRLRGNEHGFVCLAVNDDGHGDGFVAKFRDKDGRPFTAECTFEDGFDGAAKFGKGEMGRFMMMKVIERLIAARKRYFERMGSLH